MSTSLNYTLSYTDYTGPINPNPNFDKFENLVVLYGYIPSLGLNVTATVLWALTLGACLYQTYKLVGARKVYGMIAFGAVPVLFMAALHNAIGNTLQPDRKIVSDLPQVKKIVYFFCGYDIFSGVFTIVAACLFGHGIAKFSIGAPIREWSDYEQVGQILLQAAYANQIACFTLTQAVFVWIFIRRKEYAGNGGSLVLLAVWFVTTGMIWMRSIFRLGEITQGLFSVVWNSETYFAIFEFAPVWVTVVVWLVYPISRPIEEEEMRLQLKASRGSEESVENPV